MNKYLDSDLKALEDIIADMEIEEDDKQVFLRIFQIAFYINDIPCKNANVIVQGYENIQLLQ